jgi:hypothetical protein
VVTRHGDIRIWVIPRCWSSGTPRVLRTLVTDTVNGIDGAETFRMPMTQFWIRSGLRWQCLAGHAGPRLRP